MALFDITANNAYQDYPLMLPTSYTRFLPKELLAGKSETNQTNQQLISYTGTSKVFFLDKLI